MSKIEPYYQSSMTTLYKGDCLEVMPQLPDKSIDAIVADLPYGVTQQCSWDVVIPFEPLWEQYKRLIKPGGAIVLFGSQPFTSLLVASNLNWFKYEIIWEKTQPTGHLDANRRPMKAHENICVFGKGSIKYNPQITEKPVENIRPAGRGSTTKCYGTFDSRSPRLLDVAASYPKSVLKIANERGFHPTQKPLKLLKYLALSYSDPGNIILDNTCGSGSLLVAAQLTGRRSIGIEKEQEYCDVTVRRLQEITADRDVTVNQGSAEMVQSTLFTIGAIE